MSLIKQKHENRPKINLVSKVRLGWRCKHVKRAVMAL